jgi:prevent-host-death family protein
MRIGVSEARAILPELVGRVLDGEEITLTRHGQDVAVLVNPQALRRRRNSDVFEAAERLRVELEEAAKRPLSTGGLSRRYADELVDYIRRGRDAR